VLRVGVLGLGSWGLEHLRAWLTVPGVCVVAVCDRDPGRAGSVADHFAIDARYTSAEAMALDAGLDAVSIVGGESDRLQTARPFFGAGVHTLVEKPLGVDLDSARRLVAGATSAGVLFMTGHLLRFDARVVALKRRLDEGVLGSVRSIYARRLNLQSAHEKYARTHPALMAQIHDLDLACWLFDAMPLSVRAHELRDPGGGSPVPPRVLWTTLEFADGIAVAEHAWALPDAGGVWLEAETEVIGTEGIARLRSPGDALEVSSATGQERFDPAFAAVHDSAPASALKEQLSYFAWCITHDQEPQRLTSADALRAHIVALAVVEAAQTGLAVKPSPVGVTGKTTPA
jgi:UDP-N-acetylglucosamine 3-dehydrogenase